MSDQPPDEEGADLAAQFFKTVSDRQISIEGDEIDFADADEAEMTNDISGNVAYEGGDNADEELDDNDDAILREYDVTSTEGSTLTDGQIYDEVKDRVFESAGSFLEMTKGADESGSSEEDGFKAVYQPPSTNPDSGLTAGEVVELGKWKWICFATFFVNAYEYSIYMLIHINTYICLHCTQFYWHYETMIIPLPIMV